MTVVICLVSLVYEIIVSLESSMKFEMSQHIHYFYDILLENSQQEHIFKEENSLD